MSDLLGAWNPPEKYEHIITADAAILADGSIIAPGTRLIDLFPDGMLIVVDDNQKVKGVVNCSKERAEYIAGLTDTPA